MLVRDHGYRNNMCIEIQDYKFVITKLNQISQIEWFYHQTQIQSHIFNQSFSIHNDRPKSCYFQ